MVSKLVRLLYKAALEDKYNLRGCLIAEDSSNRLWLAHYYELRWGVEPDGTRINWLKAQEFINEQQ